MSIEEEEEVGDSRIERVRGCLAILSMLKVKSSGPGVQFVSLEALKMYCVIRASAPSVYRRYDTTMLYRHEVYSLVPRHSQGRENPPLPANTWVQGYNI